MTSPSVGDAGVSLPSTSRSHTRSNVRDVKPQTSTLKSQLQDLLNNPGHLRGVECFVGQIIKLLDQETSRIFVTALNDKRVRHVDLVKVCAAEGYKMSEATMRRHRAGGCRCSR